MSGKSELKIFDDYPPQVVVESGYFEDIHPTTSLDNVSVLEFVIPSSNVDYLDLNDTLLTLKLKIVKKDGSAFKDTDIKPVPENFFLYSLFSDVSLQLNDIQIDGGSSIYPFKASIESLLNFNKESIESKLQCLGFDMSKDNRQKWVGKSDIFEISGALRLDFLNQPKYLIPGVNIRIRLTRSTDDFALVNKKGDTDPGDGAYKIIITHALLYVRRVKVHPAITKAHTLGLETKNALYPYNRSKTVSFTIPQGSTSYFKDNLFSSNLLPKLVVIGMVRGAAFSGTLKQDSLWFENFAITSLDLLRDGQSLPYRRGYSCQDGKNLYTDVYVRSILQNMNLLNTNSNSYITYDNFKKGQCLFVFNLTPDFDLQERQIARDSNLRLDLSFNAALSEAINVIAYALYDATLQITSNRDIIKDVYS